MARTVGLNSGVGIAKAEMPIISSTASADCSTPTIRRPSWNMIR
jgi:hypothetical protein